MQVRVVGNNEWSDIFEKWKIEASFYGDDLGYIPNSMYTKEGEIVVIFDNRNNALLAVHTRIAQLPKTNGDTLRSTHTSNSPYLEFNEYNENYVLEIYSELIRFVYNYSIELKCNNVKVYTPKKMDMIFWQKMLSDLSETANSKVIHQGRWTTLLDNI